MIILDEYFFLFDIMPRNQSTESKHFDQLYKRYKRPNSFIYQWQQRSDIAAVNAQHVHQL